MSGINKKWITVWLISAMIMTLSMVIIGGITRLTHSGLSMVEWKPIMGIIPPGTESEWVRTFDLYKQFPEYQQNNPTMTLSEFKAIFFWEYLHRLIGRLMGLVFIVPYVWIHIRGGMPRWLNRRLVLMFGLGVLQGLAGWWMVKSGLVDRPDVSHFRLAIHLFLALTVIAVIGWTLFDVHTDTKDRHAIPTLRTGSIWILAGVAVQILYGAMTAGLDGGFGYNTFPLMNGRLVPGGFFAMDPSGVNLVSNPHAVQFLHRSLAWLLFLSIIIYRGYARGYVLTSRQRWAVNLMILWIGFQFLLGVFTLILTVPIVLAVLHQTGAVIMLLVTLFAVHSFSVRPEFEGVNDR